MVFTVGRIHILLLVMLVVPMSLLAQQQREGSIVDRLEQSYPGYRPIPESPRTSGLHIPGREPVGREKPQPQQNNGLVDVITFQRNLAETMNPLAQQRLSLWPLDNDSLASLPEEAIKAHLIDNVFELDHYSDIDRYWVASTRRNELGEPFVRYISIPDTLTYYVVSGRPTRDVHLDRRSTGSMVQTVYETKEGVRFHDETSEIFVYRIRHGRGLMMVRGNYVYIDSNVNGIPEEIYMTQRYRNSQRKYIHYMNPLQKGEQALKGSSKQKLYTDALSVLLSYVQDYCSSKQ